MVVSKILAFLKNGCAQDDASRDTERKVI